MLRQEREYPVEASQRLRKGCGLVHFRSLSSYDEVVEEKYKCEILGQCNIGMGSSTPVEQIMSVSVRKHLGSIAGHLFDRRCPFCKGLKLRSFHSGNHGVFLVHILLHQ